MAILTINRTVQVQRTADEWELYADLPGANEAAAELNRAVEAGINSSSSLQEAYRKIWPAFQKHAELGACDGEPLYHLERILQQVYRESR